MSTMLGGCTILMRIVDHFEQVTVLVREYRGERHTVTVVPDGFVWHDTTYTSLSTIARAITGTAWNGPRFFGLRVAGRRATDEDSSRSSVTTNHADLGRASGRQRNDNQARRGQKMDERSKKLLRGSGQYAAVFTELFQTNRCCGGVVTGP
jgi:hypothetical protein